MRCAIDGLPCTRECDVCRVEKIKEKMCILDGGDCDNCKSCENLSYP